MRNIFWQISSTLDGYMEDPDGKLDRTAEIEDEEFKAYVAKMLNSIDAFIIGRKTYEVFVGYWPNATGWEADILNDLPKYVVSTTLDRVEWNNATLVRDVEPAIRELKQQNGRDIAVFGSATLAASLIELGLIDECRIMITPFLLGAGNRAFKATKRQLGLSLANFEKGSSGTMFLTYRPDGQAN